MEKSWVKESDKNSTCQPKSDLLKRLASLLWRLHNTGAEFVDQKNKTFIFDLKLVTVTPFAWCCFLLPLEFQTYQCLI